MLGNEIINLSLASL